MTIEGREPADRPTASAADSTATSVATSTAAIPRWRRWGQPVVGLAVSVVSVWLLIQLVDTGEVRRSLRSTEPLLVALAVGLLFTSLAAKAQRWRLLLPPESNVSFLRLFGILQMSMFLNNVLPLRAGDFARGAMAVRRPGLRLGHVLASMLAERAIDGVTLLIAFLLVAPFIARGALLPDLTPGRDTALVLLGGALALAVLAAAAWRFWRRVSPVWSSTALAFGESWRRLGTTDGWSIWANTGVAWLSAFAINLVLFEAMGVEVSPLMAVVVTCTTNLAMLVPSSPAHIGAYHAAATVTLVVAGVGASTAASFSVLSHLVNVVPVSLVGATLLAADALPRRVRGGG